MEPQVRFQPHKRCERQCYFISIDPYHLRERHELYQDKLKVRGEIVLTIR